MKASEKHRDLPVIMVTAMGQKENIREALEAGACAYISKPFDAEILSKKIQIHLRKETE